MAIKRIPLVCTVRRAGGRGWRVSGGLRARGGGDVEGLWSGKQG